MIQIQAKNIFEGLHYYEKAPDEVAFLRSPHRHQFVVRTTIEVFEEDRELEFLLVKKEIQEFVMNELGKNGIIDLGCHSCEWLANLIIRFVHSRYSYHRAVSVSVFEDDENGAIVTER